MVAILKTNEIVAYTNVTCTINIRSELHVYLHTAWQIMSIIAGHFAYVESSMKANGSFGRLSSPTFTKPAGQSGGCVQFYYHMYGADMGTLEVRVYDTESSGDGLVKEWSKSGNESCQSQAIA